VRCDVRAPGGECERRLLSILQALSRVLIFPDSDVAGQTLRLVVFAPDCQPPVGVDDLFDDGRHFLPELTLVDALIQLRNHDLPLSRGAPESAQQRLGQR